MCYDYHGKWDKKTGHNAPLHSRPTESPADHLLNVEYTLAYLIKRGAKPEKTVLGVPLYGRAFTLANPNSNKIGAPAKDTAFQVNKFEYTNKLSDQENFNTRVRTREKMVS